MVPASIKEYDLLMDKLPVVDYGGRISQSLQSFKTIIAIGFIEFFYIGYG